jgi:hypothetical protein
LISAGSIANGDTFKQAMNKILNRVEVLSILNYDIANLNLSIDLSIDDATFFDDKTARDALDALLQASNSILYIDENDNILIKPRQINSNKVWELYNDGDLYGRENIISINNVNTGLQRCFNSVKVNDIAVQNNKYINLLNLRQKVFNFGFLTDNEKFTQIAENILNEFKFAKIELEIEVRAKDFINAKLLDVVEFDYQSVAKTSPKQPFILTYNQYKYDQNFYPVEIRNLNLSHQIKYKIIGIYHQPKNMNILLKLRQTGNNISDGYFIFLLDSDEEYILTHDFKKIIL